MKGQLERIIQRSGLDPASCVLRHVTRTSRLVVATFDAAYSPLGLTGHQFNALMTLARSGPLNVNDLATAVGMHPSTTPRIIAPLVRRGWVRTQAGTDRREHLMAVTRKGTAKLLRAFPKWCELHRGIVGRLGKEEWSAAIEVLREIRRSLRQPREFAGHSSGATKPRLSQQRRR